MIKVDYNFYEEYKSDKLLNKLEKRIKNISKRHLDIEPYQGFLMEYLLIFFLVSFSFENITRY